MHRRLTTVSTIIAVAAVGAVGSCTVGNDDAGPAPTATFVAESSPLLDARYAATRPSSTSFASQPPEVPAADNGGATVAANTIVMAVPPMPADLSPLRPNGTVAESGDGHDHDGEEAATSADVAVVWIVAMYTARFDDPDGLVVSELTSLAATADVATAAAATIEPVDLERSEARWPIVTAVTDVGADTWRITFVVKRTLTGQVGPSTSDPLAVAVTVLDGHVTALSPAEAS